MRVLIAERAGRRPDRDEARDGLIDALRMSDWTVERLALPLPGDVQGELKALASHRMMRIGEQSDVLVCLDPFAAILRHPRKYALLRPDDFAVLDDGFTGNVLRASVGECVALLLSSPVPKPHAQRFAGQAVHQIPDLDSSTRIGWKTVIKALAR